MKQLFATMRCSSFDWPSIVVHSPSGLMYIAYGLVILVLKSIQVTIITVSYLRALSVSTWKKCWIKCIILTNDYWLKSVAIVTECIRDHNATNKCNNSLNLICMLNDLYVEYCIKQKSKLIGTRNVVKCCISIYLLTASFIRKNTCTTYSHNHKKMMMNIILTSSDPNVMSFLDLCIFRKHITWKVVC